MVSQELINDIYREKVLRARRMSPADKFFEGARLFDYACEIARAGIRMQQPDISDDQVESELSRRLRLSELLESHQ